MLLSKLRAVLLSSYLIPSAIIIFSSISKSCAFQFSTRLSGRSLHVPHMTKRRKQSSQVRELQNWMDHKDASYHHFSPEDAAEIRLSLLNWYRENRRKLPWRGDAPPFDGSTAGINNVAKAAPSTDADDKKKQASIKSFLTKADQKSPEENGQEGSAAATTIEPETVMKAIPASAYGTWVSEIMLQQTRVESVIPFWCKWMQSFPTVQDLANTSEESVNAHWAGLGFYRRVRLLHKGAKYVVEQLDGNVPQTVDELLKIDGIGPYTAAAVASIAFNATVPVVDGNVCRVLSRLTGIANNIKAPALKDKHGWELAKQIVEAGDGKHAGEVNQAMMELGATFCAPSGTGVDERDPLKKFYLSTRLSQAYVAAKESGDLPYRFFSKSPVKKKRCVLCDADGIGTALDRLQELSNTLEDPADTEASAKLGHQVFPLSPPKNKRREEDIVVASLSIACQGELWWLLIKRPNKGLLAGQWEFPAVLAQTRSHIDSLDPSPTVRKKLLNSFMDKISFIGSGVGSGDGGMYINTTFKRKKLSDGAIEHIFSHIKHIMWVEHGACEMDQIETKAWMSGDGREVRWMRETDMEKVGITARVKKILNATKKEVASNKSSTPNKRKRP